MMGKKSIEIDGKENVSLEITLAYVVAGVNVSLMDVPTDVSAVAFSLSPLYPSVSFDGEYEGTSQKVEWDCFLS